MKGNYNYARKQAKHMSKIYGYTLIQVVTWEDYKDMSSLIMTGFLIIVSEKYFFYLRILCE